VKLKEARDNYDRRSTKLSDVVRQLNFAGIAVIWLFRTGEKTGGIPYSNCLMWPLGLLICSATFDLLHYAYASAAWGIFHRQEEKKLKNDRQRAEREIHAPRAINWPSLIFFWGKTILTVAAYCFLIAYIAQFLFGSTQKEKKNENIKVSYRPPIQIRFCANRFHVSWVDWLGGDSPDRAETFPRHQLAMVAHRVAT